MSPDGVLALYRSQARPLTAYFVRRTSAIAAYRGLFRFGGVVIVVRGDLAGWTGYAPLRTP